MDHHLDLDNIADHINRHLLKDEGYFSESDDRNLPATPPAVPTNTPVQPPSDAPEDAPEISLGELFGDGVDEKRDAPLVEPPGDFADANMVPYLDLRPGEQVPGNFWPDALTMTARYGPLLLVPMAASYRPPVTVWASGILALTVVTVTHDGAQRAESSQGVSFLRSMATVLIAWAVILLLFLSLAALARMRGLKEAKREPRRGR